MYEPLEKFVKGYSFDAIPSEKISGRITAVSAQAPPQATTISFKNFIFEGSPTLALLI